MDTIKTATSESLIALLIRLEIQKHDDYRNDGYYQKQIDAVHDEIISRMNR